MRIHPLALPLPLLLLHVPASRALSTPHVLSRWDFLSASASALILPQATGVALPDAGEIAAAVPRDWTKVDDPVPDFSFARLDASDDAVFYDQPRFVEHVDDNAVRKMTDYVDAQIGGGVDAVLDLCSSWTSHATRRSASRFVGVGMNQKELEANRMLTEFRVQDLNRNPELSAYGDDTFDVALCQLSVDYLTKPLEVFRDVSRVLKPNGTVHVLFSNRLFLSKAVGMWTGADDVDHAYLVACYLHFCGGNFTSIEAEDLSARNRQGRIVGDPLYVVRAKKAG